MKRARKSGFYTKKKKDTKSVVIDSQSGEGQSRLLKKKEELEKRSKRIKQRKKYAAIFSVSLIVIIVASLLVLSFGGLFDKEILEEIEPVDEVSGKVNALILGVDKEGLRTDTIIVASYDATKGVVNMLSVPRDTRMYIGSRYQKINSAHAITGSNGKIKGPNGTIDAVTRLTGIPINYYVEFSFEAFRDTIDALGGVYFDVPQTMKYKDPTQDLVINLSPGYQLLDGDKAEQLVRFRQYPQGDIKRVEVQQQFIKALAEQKLNAQIITKLPDIYKALSKNVKTNFNLGDAVKYANSLVNIDLNNIVMHELPGEYSGSEYTASYWLPDMKEIKLLVQNTFGYETKDITSGKPITGAVYGKTTTEILAPEDVVVLESDKHKPPVVNDEKTTEKEDKEGKEDKNKDEEEGDEKKESVDKPVSSKPSKRPNTITEDKKEEEEIAPPVENKEPDEEQEPPRIKPIEDINKTEDFVRPGAN